LRGDAYALDQVSRELPEASETLCPATLEYVTYAGELVRYKRPVQVAAPFVPKLRAFEAIVVEVAREHYGRAPDRLVHFGARVCRRVRGNSTRLSEHALGNALDLSGFEWQRAKENEGSATRKPARNHTRPSFERAFSVSSVRHWNASEPGVDQRHRDFLRALAGRVTERELSRCIVGPVLEFHATHLHHDYAPWTSTLF
jgi:hypothetical protein